MLFALIFIWNRITQIVTLIPAVGMLAWFVNIFSSQNALTPDPILVLFIVTVLALSWAVCTLFLYHRSSHNALFVAFVDLCFVGALIAGVYYLRGIANADCENPAANKVWTNNVAGVNIPGFSWGVNKPCAMLKASWAFGIMNCVFFAITAFAAWSHGDSVVYTERVVRTSSSGYHSGRHSHRHRSHSGGSRHSHNSHRRVYV